jgi:hypothetical protein
MSGNVTRKQKALADTSNRWSDNGVETMYSNGSWSECCPAFIDCGYDDLDEDTKVGDYGKIKGCRGVTCKECWEKPL